MLKFGVYGISLANSYTIVYNFANEERSLSIGAMIVVILHELSNQLQRHKITTVTEYFNSYYTPEKDLNEEIGTSSLAIVPPCDHVTAKQLDLHFDVLTVKHKGKNRFF